MSELTDAIQEFKNAYADLFDLAEYWPTDRRMQPGACGTWSAREVLAHCSGWIVEVNRRYDGYDAGDTQKVQYDFDEFNARSVNTRDGRTWDEIVRELHGQVDSVIARAQALPAEKVDDKRYWRWLAVLAEDCREHTEGLRAFLGGRMSYPILEFDSTPVAMIEPGHLRQKVDNLPEHCVICFFNDVLQALHTGGAIKSEIVTELRSEIGRNPIYVIEQQDGRRFVALHPGVGAPLAAGFLEEAIALGCRKFIACGGAGVLNADLAVGHVVVPTSAVRDEGTSYHYLPPGREVAPSPEGLAAIEAALDVHSVPYVKGKTWTTDALYRETPAKVALRRDEGCLTVEMEASAFFAVAQFRGVTFAQLLYSGDDLSGAEWDFRDWVNHGVREKLFWLAVEAVLRL